MPAGIAAQVAPSHYQVKLTWDAPVNSTDAVAGYNAYRAPGGGTSYQQINAAEIPLTPTAYFDLNVLPGQTYDYIVESVDASENTSAPSNETVIVLPALNLPPTVGQATVKAIP